VDVVNDVIMMAEDVFCKETSAQLRSIVEDEEKQLSAMLEIH
jgi:hypothetical protein